MSRVQDHVDAELGVSALVVGFLLQAAGFVPALLGLPPASTGWAKVVSAASLALVWAGLVWLFWRCARGPRTKRFLPRVALAGPAWQTEGDADSRGWTPERGMYLMELGVAAGYLPRLRDGRAEHFRDYVKRVFDVEAPGPLPPSS